MGHRPRQPRPRNLLVPRTFLRPQLQDPRPGLLVDHLEPRDRGHGPANQQEHGHLPVRTDERQDRARHGAPPALLHDILRAHQDEAPEPATLPPPKTLWNRDDPLPFPHEGQLCARDGGRLAPLVREEVDAGYRDGSPPDSARARAP
ncbi:hypothetical protein EYC84_002470 [Monilinia fructicola]|uniref:Uncharacterized protein n=1 Tax=Monilinia fructicola TaxID=38448 RepID=A0A5M9JNB4_MONFR|nr:hypothetical protein EYC84_002470 [Monilinia fructicola]